ncbi:hypothetical protein K0M31_001810 [Melipona bicolor]|uniref:Uncharacterized protein n=1 Tax=Melipona bicolor TaxID=60889 RepID=A0AA40KYI0_9HYME|nr:hypothetical protein K0M31_001810 [Melipona bicolor]
MFANVEHIGGKEEKWSGSGNRLAAKIVSVQRQIVGIRDVSTRDPRKYELVSENDDAIAIDEIARKPVKRNPFFREPCALSHMQ